MGAGAGRARRRRRKWFSGGEARREGGGVDLYTAASDSCSGRKTRRAPRHAGMETSGDAFAGEGRAEGLASERLGRCGVEPMGRVHRGWMTHQGWSGGTVRESEDTEEEEGKCASERLNPRMRTDHADSRVGHESFWFRVLPAGVEALGELLGRAATAEDRGVWGVGRSVRARRVCTPWRKMWGGGARVWMHEVRGECARGGGKEGMGQPPVYAFCCGCMHHDP
ncbi:hypothetical protein C8R44DRAFT_736373 [Mycena epipterygia]|nr:hypothetical protein C8R44DRAFT_736373 [Mycena epipterygia]